MKNRVIFTLAIMFFLGNTLFLAAAEPEITHRVLVSGCSSKKLALVAKDGKIEWSIPVKTQANDCSLIDGDKILYSYSTGARLVDRQGKVHWEHTIHDEPVGGEIHAAQMLDNGNILIGKSCNPPVLLEISRNGEIVKRVPIRTKIIKAHAMFRQVRKTPQGTYLYGLMAGEKEECNKLYEVNDKGEIVRTFPVALHAYTGVRLPNGNTLIAGGEGHEILEYDAKGALVWKVGKNDLPGHPLTFIGGLQRLPNGNTVFTNWHGHEARTKELMKKPQALEITPDKKVVWEFNDYANLPFLSSIEVLDENVLHGQGEPLR